MNANTYLLIAISVIISIALGIITNVLANVVQPHLEKRLRLTISIFISLVIASVLTTILLSTKSETIPVLPGQIVSGEILFEENAKWHIFRMVDGYRKEVNLPTTVSSVTWSPDGDYILFSDFNPDSTKYELFLYKVSTGEISPFLALPDLNIDRPTWSPNGNLIAFLVTPEEFANNVPNFNIYTYDPSAGQLKRLTESSEQAVHPSWSPNSLQIAYEGFSSEENAKRLFVMNFDGSNKQVISFSSESTIPSGNHQQPAWSPNGHEIAFVISQLTKEDIWVINLKSNQARPFFENPDNQYSVFPTWSSDGKWLSFHLSDFSSNHNGFGNIYISNLDRSALYRVTTSHSTWWRSLAWKP